MRRRRRGAVRWLWHHPTVIAVALTASLVGPPARWPAVAGLLAARGFWWVHAHDRMPAWPTSSGPAGRTALYRWYDARGRLLYVGVSFDAVSRFGQHRRDRKPWTTSVASCRVVWYATRVEALAAERRAIVTERPQANIAHAGRAA